MNWLNYNHLYYFWQVARAGSITAAAQELGISQPTLSVQLKSLETALGEKLFEKRGRYLVLTEPGQMAARYCEKIFSLGTELFELMEGKSAGKAELLRIGISDVLPKSPVYRILEPVYSLEVVPRLVLVEDHAERLLTELAVNNIDIVLSDCPIPPSVRVRAYNHLLGESGISFLASPSLQKQYVRSFPACLATAPVLWPSANSSSGIELERWMEQKGLVPNIVAEIQDRSMMKLFGRHGRGLFPVPTPVEQEVCKETGTRIVGRISELLERFYMISTEKRLRHPAIALLCREAKKKPF